MKVRYDKLAIYPNAIQTGCDTMFDHKADTFCRYTKVNNKQHELINQLVAFNLDSSVNEDDVSNR